MPNVHHFPYDHVPYDQIAISKSISQWSIDDWNWDFIYSTIPTKFHTHPYAIFVCLNVDNVSVINHSVKILDYWCLIIMLSSAPTIVHPHLYIYIYINYPASRKVKFYEVFCKRPSFTRSSGLLGFIELSPFSHQCWIWLEPHLKLLMHDWEAFNHLQMIAPNGPFQVAMNSH